MHSRTRTALLTFAILSLACADDTSSECVKVDEQLGDPLDRLWCEGEYSPQTPWNGELAASTMSLCFAPESGGECKLCPRTEVIDEVEARIHESLAAKKPNCSLEHWEFGCMRTVENAKLIGWETEYCCYQAAIWGAGCKDDLTD